MAVHSEELRRRIVGDINAGTPGAKLGSERDLAEQYGTSRSSLRQVLAALEEAGLVHRVIGRAGGIFISHGQVERHLSDVVGVPAFLANQGYVAGTRVLSTRITTPDDATKTALRLGPGDYVIEIQRVRLADGSPISLEHAQFPADAFPGLLDQQLRGSGLLADAEALFGDTLFGVDQIRDLVINLRNFSRLDSAHSADVALNDCVEQTLVIANSVLKGRVQVVKQLAPGLPLLRGAASQINQVLLNLVTNAAQAISHEQGQIVITSWSEAGQLYLSVADNGKGIAPEHLPRVFDPFFTTKPVGEGTGLGLSISFQIAQAHGGNLSVRSEVGHGTCFTLALPAKAAVRGSTPRAVEEAA